MPPTSDDYARVCVASEVYECASLEELPKEEALPPTEERSATRSCMRGALNESTRHATPTDMKIVNDHDTTSRLELIAPPRWEWAGAKFWFISVQDLSYGFPPEGEDPLEEDEELALKLALEAFKRQTADMEP